MVKQKLKTKNQNQKPKTKNQKPKNKNQKTTKQKKTKQDHTKTNTNKQKVLLNFCRITITADRISIMVQQGIKRKKIMINVDSVHIPNRIHVLFCLKPWSNGVGSSGKLNLRRDLRWVAKRTRKFPRKLAQVAKKKTFQG